MLVGVVRINSGFERLTDAVVPMLVGVVRSDKLRQAKDCGCPHARGGGPTDRSRSLVNCFANILGGLNAYCH